MLTNVRQSQPDGSDVEKKQRQPPRCLFGEPCSSVALPTSVLVFHNPRLIKGLPVPWEQTGAASGSVPSYDTGGSGSSAELTPTPSPETWRREAGGQTLVPALTDHLTGMMGPKGPCALCRRSVAGGEKVSVTCHCRFSEYGGADRLQ